jgi:hypothetical protein
MGKREEIQETGNRQLTSGSKSWKRDENNAADDKGAEMRRETANWFPMETGRWREYSTRFT